MNLRLPAVLRDFERKRSFRPDHINHGALASRTHTRATIGYEFGLECDSAYVDHGSKKVVLFLHGNRYNLTWFNAQYSLFDTLGLSYFTFDYPGYGLSKGEPSEHVLYASARAAYSHLRKMYGAEPDQVVVYGLSLGAAVATELLLHHPARCFIAECPFSCTWEMARLLYPHIPFWWLFPNRFRNDLRWPSLQLPIFLMHGQEDKITPIKHSRRLFELTRGDKTFRVIEGAGHTDCLARGGESLLADIRTFIGP